MTIRKLIRRISRMVFCSDKAYESWDHDNEICNIRCFICNRIRVLER